MLDGSAIIACLQHIRQQIAQPTTQFKDFFAINARQDLALPAAPLARERDRAGEAIEVAVLVKHFEEQFAHVRFHCGPAFKNISSRSPRYSMVRSGVTISRSGLSFFSSCLRA